MVGGAPGDIQQRSHDAGEVGRPQIVTELEVGVFELLGAFSRFEKTVDIAGRLADRGRWQSRTACCPRWSRRWTRPTPPGRCGRIALSYRRLSSTRTGTRPTAPPITAWTSTGRSTRRGLTAVTVLDPQHANLTGALLGTGGLAASYLALATGGLGVGDFKLAGVLGLALGWYGWAAV